MRVLIAFDKFKDAISAAEACEVSRRALRAVRPEWQVEVCPLSDGGDGFESTLTSALRARPVDVTVCGPDGAQVVAGLSLVEPRFLPPAAQRILAPAYDVSKNRPLAVIEMARASGLHLLPPSRRNPLHTTSYGTGQLMRAAAELGAGCIVLGVGGSATNDLGLGALNALGLDFRGSEGQKVRPPFPASWARITGIEGAVFAALPPVLVATDVANPLLGYQGCTWVYGRQKGLTPKDTEPLEEACAQMAQKLCEHFDQPMDLANREGAGAAGGIAFGLSCAAGARIVPGFSFFSACVDLEEKLGRADVVLTGEGRFDATSARGKGPGRVADIALAHGKTLHIIAGHVTEPPTRPGRFQAHALSGSGPVTQEMLQTTGKRLAEVVRSVLGPE